MKLIVGLGNPGQQYVNTRHNVGFMVVDHLAEKLGLSFTQLKFKGVLAEGRICQHKLLLLKPLTYMNLSGESVIQVLHFYKLQPEQLLVIYDDLDTPVGDIRLRMKGSAGGHNGIKSIIQHVGTEEFDRIRVGIGRPEPGKKVVNYVLENFHNQELEDVRTAIQKSSEAAEMSLIETFEKVMNKYN
jgi:PTH1 family peptidyl-tRNA hydrolase